MSDDSVQTEEIDVELPRVRDANFSNLYSNWVQAGRTPWDVALAFGTVREIQPNSFAIVELVNIALTPALAKALIGTLTATVKEFEEANGPIVIPESLKRLTEQRRKRLSSSPSASLSPSASASPSPEPTEDET